MSSTTYETTARTSTRVVGNPARRLVSPLARLARTLITWQERESQRAHLAELPDYLLKDMGLSRTDADQESGKSFWRA